MRIATILAALALSVNTASANISTAVSLDTKYNRVYTVFYEDGACDLATAWDCAYVALVCYVPEKLIGGVLMHVRPEQIMDNYTNGTISVDGGTEPIYMVRPVKNGADWVLSVVSDATSTRNLIAALPHAVTIDIAMGDYRRTLRLNDAGRHDVARVTTACS